MNALHPSRSDSIIERLTAIKPFQNPPKALLHIYRPLTRKITEKMFTYLDGVETNIGVLIITKTNSRFRGETERTLVLQINLTTTSASPLAVNHSAQTVSK